MNEANANMKMLADKHECHTMRIQIVNGTGPTSQKKTQNINQPKPIPTVTETKQTITTAPPPTEPLTSTTTPPSELPPSSSPQPNTSSVMVVECDRMHHLKLKPIENASEMYCDVCGETLGDDNAELYVCVPCEWCICHECVAKKYADELQKTNNPYSGVKTTPPPTDPNPIKVVTPCILLSSTQAPRTFRFMRFIQEDLNFESASDSDDEAFTEAQNNTKKKNKKKQTKRPVTSKMESTNSINASKNKMNYQEEEEEEEDDGYGYGYEEDEDEDDEDDDTNSYRNQTNYSSTTNNTNNCFQKQLKHLMFSVINNVPSANESLRTRNKIERRRLHAANLHEKEIEQQKWLTRSNRNPPPPPPPPPPIQNGRSSSRTSNRRSPLTLRKKTTFKPWGSGPGGALTESILDISKIQSNNATSRSRKSRKSNDTKEENIEDSQPAGLIYDLLLSTLK